MLLDEQIAFFRANPEALDASEDEDFDLERAIAAAGDEADAEPASALETPADFDLNDPDQWEEVPE